MSLHSSEGSSKGFRPLLPADKRPPSPAATGAHRRPVPRRPTRKSVPTACDECRKHKAKCTGERPRCRRCASRHIPCHYVAEPGETPSQALGRSYQDLRSQASAHRELIHLLQDLPEQEAQGILRRLRSGVDIDSILNHVQAGDVLLQMAVAPETRLRYEFPYRSEMPQEFVMDNPYLDSLVYEATSLYATSQSQSPSDRHIATWLGSSTSGEDISRYVKPFHAAHVVDSLLSDVRPSLWTTVCSDNMLMRDLLRVFLRCEYQFTAAFQKDLFLEDMASQATDFCSSLLVNIILAYCCVCYPPFKDRAEYWNPRTLTYRFFAEARRVWELEATVPRITTIQTGILFSVLYNLFGLDEVGQPYRIQAVALAKQIRLFEPTIDGKDDRIRRGKAFTAWTLYNWETLVAFSFMHFPTLKEPPIWNLPDPSQDASWYGETWVQYPMTQSLSPMYFGHIFRARSQFRVIMNKFCQAAYSDDPSVTIYKANLLRSQLQRWYDELPNPLLPKMIVLPGHLQLHMYYYHLLLTIFEPLLDKKTDHRPAPQEVVLTAGKHLQTLIRLYYLRHGFESMDLFIVIPLMLVAYQCIDAIKEETSASQLETLRSTLILMAKGLSNQRRNHYLAEALYRVIKGRMRPQEVALLKDTLDVDEVEADEKKEMVQAVRSHWPVSVVRKKEDMDSHILGYLVESYGRLNIE